MIEQIMIFALGFLVSGLLALLFLPAFWRRALRLSRRRLEMLTPLSMDEILAERDQLRAQAAVEIRRAEQKLESLTQDRAGLMSEIARRAGVIARLEAELGMRAATLRDRDADLNAAWAELGALHVDGLDLAARLTQTRADLAALQASEARLREDHDKLRIEKATLETSLDRLHIQEEDLRQRLKATQLDLGDKAALARKLEDERDFLRKELESLGARRDDLAATLEKQSARIQELEQIEQAERRDRIHAQTALAAANQFIAHFQTGAQGAEDAPGSEVPAQSPASQGDGQPALDAQVILHPAVSETVALSAAPLDAPQDPTASSPNAARQAVVH